MMHEGSEGAQAQGPGTGVPLRASRRTLYAVESLRPLARESSSRYRPMRACPCSTAASLGNVAASLAADPGMRR